ncbi:hypothetical protein HMPREF9520_01232 [Enterococcus faecalis TX1467]|nr:hypothetical protein HMPREF9520_01232 [Enterococcus faecalis TX1467]
MKNEKLAKGEMNLNALFIGDKAENGQLYKDLLIDLVDEHLGWRQNYMPQDMPVISLKNAHLKATKKLSTI